MLEVILRYWPLILALFLGYGFILRLYWKMNVISKDRTMCEARCSKRVDDLQAEYNGDLKEIKDDLRENMKLSQSMNLSLVSLTSYLQGKGVTPQ